jgi:hypothetical protein
MQGTQFRCLILIGLFAAAASLLTGIDGPRPLAEARWPSEAATYAVDGWTASPTRVDTAHGVTFATTIARRADGLLAEVALATSPEAKRIYRASAGVPFLGNGYTVDPAPPSLVPPSPERGALLVRRENDLRLLLHTSGERRGLLGNGTLAWGAVVLDAVAGRPNDYYRVTVLAPLGGPDPRAARDLTTLADALFPRLAAWYAN